jgi:NADPH2:quinone reductase
MAHANAVTRRHGVVQAPVFTGMDRGPSVVSRCMPTTMRAAVLDGPGPASSFQIRELPVPVPRPGEVLIVVRASGLNRSELHTRLGLAVGVTFPRVLGIEATGVVAAAPGGEFAVGQQVMTMMGGMGRTFDGGYAEYTCVPAAQVIPFHSDLDWATLGAVPEMLQTAYGSLTVGLDLQPGQTLLIRGGTSSVGMATAVLAKDRGVTVLSTTRRPERAAALAAIGVDHVIVDDGGIAQKVRALAPDGVDAALELVGTNTLPDTLRATAIHGVVCFTGILSNEWIIERFYPIEYIPDGVRLTAYGGEASDLPPAVLQDFLDAVAAGRLRVPLYRTYALDEIGIAHADMEAGNATGKLVVLP